MLEKIDDFLLERVFQPVCDMLSNRISCYRLAVYAVWVGWIVVFGQTTTSIYAGTIDALIWLPSCLIITAESMRADRSTRLGVIPTVRLVLMGGRQLSVVMIPFLLLIVGRFAHQWFAVTGVLTIYVAVFLASCRKNPPKPKRSFVPTRWELLPTAP